MSIHTKSGAAVCRGLEGNGWVLGCVFFVQHVTNSQKITFDFANSLAFSILTLTAFSLSLSLSKTKGNFLLLLFCSIDCEPNTITEVGYIKWSNQARTQLGECHSLVHDLDSSLISVIFQANCGRVWLLWLLDLPPQHDVGVHFSNLGSTSSSSSSCSSFYISSLSQVAVFSFVLVFCSCFLLHSQNALFTFKWMGKSAFLLHNRIWHKHDSKWRIMLLYNCWMYK